ncbi:MAG: phosphoglycerate kinase [Coxiellaceae bacterium]|jgi:phosphoglycerate kinase|nr:phosphoglycerate kinase [Coxiellaceae bacterium]
MAILRMTDLDLKGKSVLIRVDFNVPLKNGVITSDKRLRASAPTLKLAADAGAKVIVLSHLGQPEEGVFNKEFSLKPIAGWLSKYFGKDIRLERDWLSGVNVEFGEIVLCENVRFNHGEKKDDKELAKKISSFCDIFVMDAFATSHRAHASTHGVGLYAPVVCAGPLFMAELEALSKALDHPDCPLVAIVGGSKVSTKLQLLENLIDKVDYLLVGGGIANTFLAANDLSVGKSLCEMSFLDKTKELIVSARKRGVGILIPSDVVVVKEMSETSKATIKDVTTISSDDMVVDIGPETRQCVCKIVREAKTIVWNGPVGVFEIDQFSEGTKDLAFAVANSKAFSVAGGGDTIAAIEKFGVEQQISYISTAGGAFLEYFQGCKLPAIEMLEARGKYSLGENYAN